MENESFNIHLLQLFRTDCDRGVEKTLNCYKSKVSNILQAQTLIKVIVSGMAGAAEVMTAV